MRNTDRDGFKNRALTYLMTNFAPIWKRLQAIAPIRRVLNRLLIRQAILKTKTRPHQFSMCSTYTSWKSLTERTYSGRHLPEATEEYVKYLETIPVQAVAELFRRTPATYRFSDKSTLLFTHFAQWFTDGFLRTHRDDFRKNTSNHEIDLCQIYGLNACMNAQLREPDGCKLKTSVINGEHFPPLYFDDQGNPKNEFSELEPHPLPDLPAHRKRYIFVGGVERLNVSVGYVMLNTLFLREHNRLCDDLLRAYPDWEPERVYQTARNTLIVILLRIVIEEYINHITPYHFQFRAEPWSFAKEKWYRNNWMTVEFNLLYRWHSMVPDCVLIDDRFEPLTDMLYNNAAVVERGIGPMFESASRQIAAEIGLFNTHPILVELAEIPSIELGRKCKLRSYNDYRELFDYPRVTDWSQISGRPEVCRALQAMYKSVDDIELYVGLFAEDVRRNSALSPLIGRMVGVDAFSQAFTNPLLSPNVFNPQTFSEVGWKAIQETSSLHQLVHRNLGNHHGSYKVTFTRDGTEKPETGCPPITQSTVDQESTPRGFDAPQATARGGARSMSAEAFSPRGADEPTFDPKDLFRKK